MRYTLEITSLLPVHASGWMLGAIVVGGLSSAGSCCDRNGKMVNGYVNLVLNASGAVRWGVTRDYVDGCEICGD